MKRHRSRSRRVVEQSVPVFSTDARRADRPTRRGEPDPESERSAKLRRRVRVLAFNVVFIAGVVAALVGEGGFLDLGRKRAAREEARQEVAAQQAKNDRLRWEIEHLEKDPIARERIAREELGMARPGEIQFLLPRESYGLGSPAEPESEEAPRVPETAD